MHILCEIRRFITEHTAVRTDKTMIHPYLELYIDLNIVWITVINWFMLLLRISKK